MLVLSSVLEFIKVHSKLQRLTLLKAKYDFTTNMTYQVSHDSEPTMSLTYVILQDCQQQVACGYKRQILEGLNLDNFAKA